MKVIHIDNSYATWSKARMRTMITNKCYSIYGTVKADEVLNRSYESMYIEWYLHNIGYWFTLPFIKKDSIKKLNERFTHVDLEEYP